MNSILKFVIAFTAVPLVGGCTDSAIQFPDILLGRVNQNPRADAGGDHSAAVGEAVILDGSASSDPDGDTLSFAWVKSSGPTTTIQTANQAKASFTPAEPGTYEFQLTVTENRGGIGRATVRISVAGEPTSTPQPSPNPEPVPSGNGSFKLSVCAFPSEIRAGDDVTYTITIENLGDVDIADATLTASVPGNVNNFSAKDTGGGSCPGSFCDPSEKITWLVTVPKGAKRVAGFSVRASVFASVGTPLVCTAIVSVPSTSDLTAQAVATIKSISGTQTACDADSR